MVVVALARSDSFISQYPRPFPALKRKRCADPTFFGVGGGATVGAVGGSGRCRFQSMVTCPRGRARAWRSGLRSSQA
jgi:hypothetical protein